jgi:hypothetical protein
MRGLDLGRRNDRALCIGDASTDGATIVLRQRGQVNKEIRETVLNRVVIFTLEPFCLQTKLIAVAVHVLHATLQLLVE